MAVYCEEPCVSLLFNPPFEMEKLASVGFPHRADSLSDALAPLRRILKRFGAQTLLAAASQFFFFFFFLSVLFGFRASRRPSKHLLFFSAGGSFKWLMGICRAPWSRLDSGVAEPRAKINSSYLSCSWDALGSREGPLGS